MLTMKTEALYTPTLKDIESARNRISKYISKTPLRYSSFFSKLTSAEVYIKYENCNPTCAFKVRGGINLVLKLVESLGIDSLRSMSLLAGSTGNHGQSIAYAGKLFNIPVTIVVPEYANSAKVSAMQDLGADVVFYGKDVFESWKHCEELSKDKKYFYVHSVEQPELFEGVGTVGLEVYEDLPEVDCFITSVGGGSGVCGSSIALKSKNPKIKIYGVQSSGAPALHDSFKQKKIVSHPSLNTFAEGLATRNVFPYALNILEKNIDDIFLVDDDELKKTIVLLLENTRNMAEGAGSASIAGLIKNKEIFKNKKVVCVLTGGNLQLTVLKDILNNYSL